MTTTEFSFLNKVTQKVKNTVFGYIRQNQSLYFTSNNPYYIIPKLVIFLCIKFYYQQLWNKKAIGSSMTISNDNTVTIKAGSSESNSAFLTDIIDEKGIYHYKFKVIKNNTNKIWSSTIGIYKIKNIKQI